ncbi:MAG TPA: response regulator [Vicinamibacterales bacterium]|nr:response regulator [Vicinamibacterales bacterium]
MKRILFVDDEVNVLDGLRNVLRKQRREWDMVFAIGGQAALDELERAPFDVIVSDMRMPGMDGAALLQKVKDRYPAIARIVLSGHAEREAVMRTLPVAHQYLSKPCEEEQLRSVITRTCNLQALLHDETIRSVIGHFDALPSAPQLYSEITEAAARSNTTLAVVSRIVEKDPALVAKVLQLVNSAYFGLAHRVTSVQQAVQFLGLDLIKGLAMTEHVFAGATFSPIEGFSVEGLQRHSLLIARVAKKAMDNSPRSDEVFAAAIVHDIGKILLACGFPDRFGEVVRMARERGQPFHQVEPEVFGTTHAEVGAYLLGAWGLPFAMVEAVAYHHRPELVPDGEREVLMAVYLAEAFIEARGTGTGAATPPLRPGVLETSGLTAADVAHWHAVARQQLEMFARGEEQ